MDRYPPRLHELLAQDQELEGHVKVIVPKFKTWFETSGVEFFREYTDHGPRHIEEVWFAAEGLITEESWEHLVPQDAAVLLLAIVLHDSGMHLTMDGFRCLIESRYTNDLIKPFDSQTWPQLWDEFLRAASRFNDEKLLNLFGEVATAREPDLDNPTQKDKFLIGEFIRWYHPRLAHEIALHGVPGPEDRRIDFAGLDKRLSNLAGLVARSHGMPIRNAADSLGKAHEKRRKYKVHASFLMAIIRIADYLQIHRERAPEATLLTRYLRSPFSEKEWQAHHRMLDLNSAGDDPEALHITADPHTAHLYLKFRSLFKDIQRELDESWALLGEIYGPQKTYCLGLSLRRLHTNLDNETEFRQREHLSFVPVDARFRSATGEILKLMVKPLYDDHWSYGLRELIQNSIDACREREDYELRNGISPQDYDVYVEIDTQTTEDAMIIVKDDGIGMTEEVILSYFLTAGASFRSSETWQLLHTDEGAPRIPRIGRFGVGVLASFLLGDRIDVTTRYVSQPAHRAIKFSCSLNSKNIELTYTNKTTPGTEIRTFVDKKVAQKLAKESSIDLWDWYVLQRPKLIRKINGQPIVQGVMVSPEKRMTLHEKPIQTNNDTIVSWVKSYIDCTSVNGIQIKYLEQRGRLDYPKAAKLAFPVNEMFNIEPDQLHIIDSRGAVELNLQRTRVTSDLAWLKNSLATTMCRFLFAELLLTTPESPSWEDFIEDPCYGYIGTSKLKFIHANAICYTKHGITLFDEWHLKTADIRCLSVLFCEERSDADWEILLPKIVRKQSAIISARPHHFDLHALKDIEREAETILAAKYAPSWIQNTGKRVMFNPYHDPRNHYYSDRYLAKKADGAHSKLSINYREILSNLDPFIQSIEFHFREFDKNSTQSLLAGLWQETMGPYPTIPYDLAQRRRIFREAYRNLSREIAEIRVLRWAKAIASKRAAESQSMEKA